MTKHIPGPWKAHTNGYDWFVTAKDFRGADCKVGKLYVMEIESFTGEVGDTFTEGNAIIAAAAPEMLDSLKQALKHLRDLKAWDDSQAVPKAFAISAIANGLKAAGISDLGSI